MLKKIITLLIVTAISTFPANHLFAANGDVPKDAFNLSKVIVKSPEQKLSDRIDALEKQIVELSLIQKKLDELGLYIENDKLKFKSNDGKETWYYDKKLNKWVSEQVKTIETKVETKTVISYRQPIGHTHTCPNCGDTWDHTKNPTHNCQKCGTPQYVVDSIPKMVPINKPIQQIYPQQFQFGGCPNGNCPLR